jgi:O-methyltransferase
VLSALRRSLGLSAGTGASAAQDERQALGEALTMLRIRQQDVRELEAMYRAFVMPELEPRAGRDEDLHRLIGTSVGEGLYVCRAIQGVRDVPGDVCEFGVAQGATSRLIANEIRASSRTLWLYDSFEGLPKPSERDVLIDDIFGLGSMDAYAGTMRSPRDLVVAKLEDIAFPMDRVRIREGWIDKTLAAAPSPSAVAFAYVDFDFYEPIKVALEWLDRHMARGASIIVDDYGFFSQGAQSAVDEFLATRRDRWSFELPAAPAGKFCLLRAK